MNSLTLNEITLGIPFVMNYYFNIEKILVFEIPWNAPVSPKQQKQINSMRINASAQFAGSQNRFIEIPPGEYWIGDSANLNSSPRISYRNENSFWIDAGPLTWNLFEESISAGVIDIRKVTSPSFANIAGNPPSIDGLCRYLLDLAKNPTTSFLGNGAKLSEKPLCGLPFELASQVCDYFHARLPTEFEWEIAMRDWRLVPNLNHSGLSNRNSVKEVYRSSFGCVAYAGIVQEWTSSQWTPRYWSGKESESGGFSTTNIPEEVSARGCSSVQTPSLTDRVRAPIFSFEIPRIFRRVWEQKI